MPGHTIPEKAKNRKKAGKAVAKSRRRATKRGSKK